MFLWLMLLTLSNFWSLILCHFNVWANLIFWMEKFCVEIFKMWCRRNIFVFWVLLLNNKFFINPKIMNIDTKTDHNYCNIEMLWCGIGASAGAIAGVVIAILAGVALIAVLSFFGYRWHKNRQENHSSSSGGVPNVAFDNRSENGDSKNNSRQSSDPNAVNYFGELESQDPASAHIRRIEIKDWTEGREGRQ